MQDIIIFVRKKPKRAFLIFILYFGPSSLCSAFATRCNFFSSHSFLLLVGTIVILSTVFPRNTVQNSSHTLLFFFFDGSHSTQGQKYVAHQQVYCGSPNLCKKFLACNGKVLDEHGAIKPTRQWQSHSLRDCRGSQTSKRVPFAATKI